MRAKEVLLSPALSEDLVLEAMLGSPRLMVLGDSKVHAKTPSGPGLHGLQDNYRPLTQLIAGPKFTDWRWCFALIRATVKGADLPTLPLSWPDNNNLLAKL